jgi:hypothetical protein
MSIRPDIQNSQTLQGIAHTTPSALCPGRRQTSDREAGRANRKGGLPVVDDFLYCSAARDTDRLGAGGVGTVSPLELLQGSKRAHPIEAARVRCPMLRGRGGVKLLVPGSTIFRSVIAILL